MTCKNTGTYYEQLIQTIFSKTQNADPRLTPAIDVQHNVKIQGTTTEHQIDVYQEFILSGFSFKTIVQSKNWNSTVKQE